MEPQAGFGDVKVQCIELRQSLMGQNWTGWTLAAPSLTAECLLQTAIRPAGTEFNRRAVVRASRLPNLALEEAQDLWQLRALHVQEAATTTAAENRRIKLRNGYAWRIVTFIIHRASPIRQLP
ncbi:hypothetical protein LA080_015305 [Diaporthe eres]|nr:hypothetical protein LA080_015305 [Diaporthe eres]